MAFALVHVGTDRVLASSGDFEDGRRVLSEFAARRPGVRGDVFALIEQDGNGRNVGDYIFAGAVSLTA
jgi:hypothetical protein